MIQNLLTYFVVIAAVFYSAYRLYRSIIPKKNHLVNSTCDGCTGCKLKKVANPHNCGSFRNA